jgi:predicted nucleic acid-binding protein
VTQYRLEANIAVELDVEAAFEWYEVEETNLGVVFLEELRSTYQRILNNPLAFQELRSGIRRALTRKFPYAIYFVIESRIILVQRLALDALIAASARRWKATVVTENWNDFAAIRRFCNVRILKASEFFE